jgi:hypothetical protein
LTGSWTGSWAGSWTGSWTGSWAKNMNVLVENNISRLEKEKGFLKVRVQVHRKKRKSNFPHIEGNSEWSNCKLIIYD